MTGGPRGRRLHADEREACPGRVERSQDGDDVLGRPAAGPGAGSAAASCPSARPYRQALETGLEKERRRKFQRLSLYPGLRNQYVFSRSSILTTSWSSSAGTSPREIGRSAHCRLQHRGAQCGGRLCGRSDARFRLASVVPPRGANALSCLRGQAGIRLATTGSFLCLECGHVGATPAQVPGEQQSDDEARAG